MQDKGSLAGRRFQERYRRRRQSPHGLLERCAFACGGVLLALVGLFFMAVPGPGIPILIVGLALIAQESAAVARLLDRAELWIRRRIATYRGRGSQTR